MTHERYVYLDVRTVPEFEAGHPTGAFNVPIFEPAVGGMELNVDFVAAVRSAIGPETGIIVGCRSGQRSQLGAQQLLEAGYPRVVEQRAGFAGAPNAFGQVQEPGWLAEGLPVAQTAEAGHSYREIRTRLGS